MDSRLTTFALYALGAAALATSVSKARTRLQLSKAKHRSLGGHSRLARRIAALVPSYAYQEERIFRVDDAPDEIALRRQAAFERLAELYKTRFARTVALTDEVAGSASDLQFTSAYRVPFQFSPFTRRHLKGGAFFKASSGVMLTDLDGNRFYDVAGSYGVNVLGYDFYKDAMADGARSVGELGPVLGALHPVVA